MIVPQPCARCGGEIPPERVEAMPETMVCVACSQEMGGEFPQIRRSQKAPRAL